MEIRTEINNKTKIALSRSFFNSVIQRTIKQSGLDFLSKKSILISIALVDQGEMRRINKTFRKKDKATDILSFAEFESGESLKKIKEKEIFLGELIICYDMISGSEKRGIKLKNKFKKRESAYVVSHGVLHLLGFRHGKKMFAIQDAVSQKN